MRSPVAVPGIPCSWAELCVKPVCSWWSSPSSLTMHGTHIFFRLASLKALPRGLPQGYLCCRGSLWRCRWCYQPCLSNSGSLQSPGTARAGSALHLQPMASAQQGIVSSTVLCPLPSVLKDKALQVDETKKMWLFCFRMNPLM